MEGEMHWLHCQGHYKGWKQCTVKKKNSWYPSHKNSRFGKLWLYGRKLWEKDTLVLALHQLPQPRFAHSPPIMALGRFPLPHKYNMPCNPKTRGWCHGSLITAVLPHPALSLPLWCKFIYHSLLNFHFVFWFYHLHTYINYAPLAVLKKHCLLKNPTKP